MARFIPKMTKTAQVGDVVYGVSEAGDLWRHKRGKWSKMAWATHKDAMHQACRLMKLVLVADEAVRGTSMHRAYERALKNRSNESNWGF